MDSGRWPMRKHFGRARRGSDISSSSDDQLVVTALQNGTATVWIVENGDWAQILEHPVKVTSLVFNLDDSSILTASDSAEAASAWLWSVSDGSLLKRFDHWQLGFITCANCALDHASVSAKFSPDCSLMITTSNDNAARVWKVESGECLQIFRHDQAGPGGAGHVYSVAGDELNEHVSSVVLAPGGESILMLGDSCSRLYNLASCDEQQVFVSSGRPISAVSSQDGTCVLIATFDGTATIMRVRRARKISTFDHGELLTLRLRGIRNHFKPN